MFDPGRCPILTDIDSIKYKMQSSLVKKLSVFSGTQANVTDVVDISQAQGLMLLRKVWNYTRDYRQDIIEQAAHSTLPFPKAQP